MITATSLSSINLQLFPKEVSENSSLSPSLKVAIKILQKSWQQYQHENCQTKTLAHDLTFSHTNKLLLIYQLARDACYLKENIQWNKICKGHDVRVNDKKLDRNKGEKLIEKLSLQYQNNPNIVNNSIKGELKETQSNSKYDVRLKFRHKNDCPSCSSLPQEVCTYELIFILSILNQLDRLVVENNLDKEKVYEILFDFVYQ